MNHHILYHEEKGMILFLTPKSGNTSFRASIVRAMGAQLGGEESYGFRWITPKEAYAIKDDNPDVRAVAFVRNPIDRTLSAWKNKILPLELEGVEFQDGVIISKADALSPNTSMDYPRQTCRLLTCTPDLSSLIWLLMGFSSLTSPSG